MRLLALIPIAPLVLVVLGAAVPPTSHTLSNTTSLDLPEAHLPLVPATSTHRPNSVDQSKRDQHLPVDVSDRTPATSTYPDDSVDDSKRDEHTQTVVFPDHTPTELAARALLDTALQFVKSKAPSRTKLQKSTPSRTHKATPPATETTRTDNASRKSTATDGERPPTTNARPNCPRTIGGECASISTESSQLDLLPPIKAHALMKITTENTGDDTNVISTSAAAYIPESLELVKGDYSTTSIARRHYLIRDSESSLKAAAALGGIPSDEEGLKLSGEVSMTAVFHTAVLNPIHQICKAMFMPPIRWQMIGLGHAPKTDLLLQVDGKNAAVIEVKTPTALDKEKMSQVWDTLERLKMGKLPLPPPRKSTATATSTQAAGSTEPTRPPKRQKLASDKYKSLVDPEDPRPEAKRHRENRANTVDMMEQVIAQMFRYKVRYGALTNFDDWLILEKKGSSITVSKLENVSKGDMSALQLVLDLTVKGMLEVLGGSVESHAVN